MLREEIFSPARAAHLAFLPDLTKEIGLPSAADTGVSVPLTSRFVQIKAMDWLQPGSWWMFRGPYPLPEWISLSLIYASVLRQAAGSPRIVSTYHAWIWHQNRGDASGAWLRPFSYPLGAVGNPSVRVTSLTQHASAFQPGASVGDQHEDKYDEAGKAWVDTTLLSKNRGLFEDDAPTPTVGPPSREEDALASPLSRPAPTRLRLLVPSL